MILYANNFARIVPDISVLVEFVALFSTKAIQKAMLTVAPREYLHPKAAYQRRH